VRAIVLQGECKAFCAGGDLHWMRESVNYTPEQNRQDAHRLADLFLAIRQCPKPVIAHVHGAVYGGGLGLLAAADLGIAQAETKFCFSEVKLGLVPAIILPFVLEKARVDRVRPWMLSAEVFSAAQAQEAGLVQHVVNTSDDAHTIIDAFCQAVSSNGPDAIAATKALLWRSCQEPRPSIDRLADSVATLADRRAAQEAQDRIAAFLNR
jgi:methylglutaconyl-CoA hydratase